MKNCVICRHPLPKRALFCPACGARVGSPGAETQAAASVPVLPAAAALEGGYSVTLESFPAPMRARVILALRQVLNYSPEYAAAYAAAAPALLASGLDAEAAETLRIALMNAGARVSVSSPPQPEPSGYPAPEPLRRLDQAAHTVYRRDFRPGLRTITGLDIGMSNTYLAYARAEVLALVSGPGMLTLDGRAALPGFFLPAAEGQPALAGAPALQAWVQQPEAVQAGLLNPEGNLEHLVGFLEILAHHLTENQGRAALGIAEGAAANLGIPVGQEELEGERLMDAATRAGFPVIRVVPRPLAALACHLQAGNLPAPVGQEKVMVVDWGGMALDISFIEHGGSLAKPHVIEHITHPLGGKRFENLLYHQLASQLPPIPDLAWERSLRVFTGCFLQDMWAAFGAGKPEYKSTYRLLPGIDPVPVGMRRESYETMIAPELAAFSRLLGEAVAGLGLEPEHIDHVILTGGCGNCPAGRSTLQDAMHRAPLMIEHPEETTARGLAIYSLRY